MDIAVNRASNRGMLIAEFDLVRAYTEHLCAPLATDDYQIQSVDQTSPPKWHIAHVSWSFEALVLTYFVPGYGVFDPEFDFSSNSYYYTHGRMHPRSKRGLLSRPTATRTPATATSSIRTNAGPSPGCVWRRMHVKRRHPRPQARGAEPVRCGCRGPVRGGQVHPTHVLRGWAVRDLPA